VRKAGLSEEKYSVSFQSRLLNDPWLKPYTDHELERLPSKNKKRLVIISPAFVADCLETIEELGMEGREEYLKAGGEDYRLVPCLNDHPLFVELLHRFVQDFQDGALLV
jgi:protoporphyrin/coproporphyrin ferrochelatase